MANYTNFAIKSRDELKSYVLRQCGYPLVTVELTEDQINDAIDNATETFTQYLLPEKRYISYDLTQYDSTSGFIVQEGILSFFDIQDSSTVLGSVGDLFSPKNVLWNAGQYPVILGSISAGMKSGSFTTLEIALQYVDLINRMLGQGFSFSFDNFTRQLRLNPDPVANHIVGWIVMGANFLPADSYLFGERWVKAYTLALCKKNLGYVRSKFDGTQLLGGGKINAAIGADGDKECDKLLDEIQNFYKANAFFVG